MALAMLVGAAGVTAAELSDPTRPPGRTASASVRSPLDRADWRLTVVRIAPGNRSAVVNGEVVRVGDSVAGAQVVDIQPGRVVIDRDGARLTLVPGGADVPGQRVVVRQIEESP